MTPTFSVIIPSYNRREFLIEAVKSVTAQSIRDFELIIIDDGSTDGTDEAFKDCDDERVIYIRQPNQGVASARNLGIKKAQGKFIAFLDSDDSWLPEKLQEAVACINQHPKISIFHTRETWMKGDRIVKQEKKHRNPDGWAFESMLKVCCISMSTIVIEKTVFEDIGIFDESFVACEDYDFLLRATLQYETKLIPKELTIKNGGREDQLSSRIWGLDRYRVNALIKLLESETLDAKQKDLVTAEIIKKGRIVLKGAKTHNNPKVFEEYSNILNQYNI